MLKNIAIILAVTSFVAMIAGNSAVAVAKDSATNANQTVGWGSGTTQARCEASGLTWYADSQTCM